MGKYRRYKNRLEMFLSSERGKRVLNFLYSWGASIVILGALFKLLHIPYANQILFVAMNHRVYRILYLGVRASEQGISLGRCFPRIEIKEPDGSSGFHRYADLNHDQFYG